jgi:hypothetical protein
MRKVMGLVLALSCAAILLFQVSAEEPGKKKAKDAKDYSDAPIVKRMMAFDKNKDGKLTKDEVTDERLHRLFDRADKNKDGVVTKDELIALAKEMAEERGDERGGPGGRGPGDGGPGGRGKRGGPGGFGGPPRPGQILPPFVRERLNLTADQTKQIEALQKEVDAKLAKILTAEQKKQLEEMPPGPGGRGGRGGRGGPGGPGGRGPGGPPPQRD